MLKLTANPDFSIVIPCYNHGQYLHDTVAQIKQFSQISCEIIIVDDGSSDAYTKEALDKIKLECTVLHQANSGPSAARNNGIRHAKGKYIVPLDADDKLMPEYLMAAAKILDSDEADVVYANYNCVGKKSDTITLKEFNVQELLLRNVVGACVIYRKSCWEAAGGYDEHLGKGLGWEDWDMWLNMCSHRFRFMHIPIVGYEYLVHEQSRERSFTKNLSNINYIIAHWEEKYPGLYNPAAVQKTITNQLRNSPVMFMLKLYLITFFPQVYKRLSEKGKYKKYIL